MKVVKLTAENVKRLRVVEITPTGALVPISGANESGKTSVLDSLYWALAGKGAIDPVPVRTGEESAQITLDLGTIIVTRKFTADGKTTIEVRSTDGAKYPSPQAMLDKLIGSLSFDPLEFTRMDPKKQLEELRKLVPLEVDLDALDRQNARDYDLRADANRSIKTIKAQREGLGLSGEKVEGVSLNDIMAARDAAIERNVGRQREAERRVRELSVIAGYERDIKGCEEEIARLETRIRAVRGSMETAQKNLEALPAVEAHEDVSTYSEQLMAAQETNDAASRWMQYDKLTRQLEEAQEQADNLTALMESRTQEKQAAIAAAQMPVEGLGFGEGLVLYRGVPFSQASSAVQTRVSVAMAMKFNPELRVLRIKDGSLLDENSLAMIADMAELEGYQVWIEIVDTSGTVGVYLEEGQVAANNLPAATGDAK